MGNAASSSPPSASAPAQHDTVSTDPEPPSSLQPPPPPSQCGDCREEFQAPGKLPFTCPHCFACTRCKTCLETIARCPNCRKLWPDRSQPNSSLSRLLGLHGNEDDNDKEDEEEIAKVGMKMQREIAGSWHAGVIHDIKDVILYTLDFDDGVTQEWTEEKMDAGLNIVAEPLANNDTGTDVAMENFAKLGTQIRPQRRAAAVASKQIKSIGMKKEPVQDVKHKRRGSNSTAQSTGSKKRPKSEFSRSNSFSKPSAAVKVKPSRKSVQASSDDSDTETQTTEDEMSKSSKIDQGQRKRNSVKRFQVDWKARVAAIREKKKASQRSQDGE